MVKVSEWTAGLSKDARNRRHLAWTIQSTDKKNENGPMRWLASQCLAQSYTDSHIPQIRAYYSVMLLD